MLLNVFNSVFNLVCGRYSSEFNNSSDLAPDGFQEGSFSDRHLILAFFWYGEKKHCKVDLTLTLLEMES